MINQHCDAFKLKARPFFVVVAVVVAGGEKIERFKYKLN
jgi:hypothetical protein